MKSTSVRTLGKLAVLSGEKHGGGAALLGCLARPRVQARQCARLGGRHLHQRRPPRRRGHGAGERLDGRGVLDAALGADAAAPERRPLQLAVHHALDGDEEHAEQRRERGDRGVRPRVPPLCGRCRVGIKAKPGVPVSSYRHRTVEDWPALRFS